VSLERHPMVKLLITNDPVQQVCPWLDDSLGSADTLEETPSGGRSHSTADDTRLNDGEQ